MFGRGKKSREAQFKEAEGVLVSDVPIYLAQPLCVWVNNAEAVLCPQKQSSIYDTPSYDVQSMDTYERQQLILKFQMISKNTVPFSPLAGIRDSGNYLLKHTDSWGLLIPYVDFLLKEMRKINDPFKALIEDTHHHGAVNSAQGTFHPRVSQPMYSANSTGKMERCSSLVIELDRTLKECSSKWTVSRDSESFGLVESIDPMQQRVVNQVLSRDDNASRYLASAYEKIFGRNPSYTEGYEDLIKAVETLSHPLVSPKSTRASLSQDANCMRDQDDWHYVIEPGEGRNKVQGGMLRPLMHALMNNDHARHGDNENFQQNTEEEAKGGFFVAVLLVEAFRDGFISRG
jgi:hypothetical protein